MKNVKSKSGVNRGAWLALCLLITFSGVKTLNAQVTNGNNWYFGNSTQAILFKKSNNELDIDTIQSVPFGQGGSAVVSDEHDGNTLFYSDGVNIFDATHQIVPDGTGLLGDSSLNQAVVGVPRPGSLNTDFYFFTNSGTTGVNEIRYTRVDRRNLLGNATQPNQPPLGAVVVGEKNIATGLVNPSPGMLAVRSSNDESIFWLLSQESVNGQLRVTEINNPLSLVTNFYSNPAAPAITAENFSAVRIAQDSMRIAIAPQNPNTNVQIWVLNISTGNPESGSLNFERTIPNSGNADNVSPAIYDTEWSRDGTKLYMSRHGSSGNTGNLFQFDYNDTLENVNSILPASIFRSYGIKLGANDTLYHLYQPTAAAPIAFGAVTQPQQTFDSTAYDLQPEPTAAFNGRQFPEQTLPNMATVGVIDFTYADSCFSMSTKFTPRVDIPPVFYFWDFGDGGTSFSHSPIHTYAAAGMYMATLSVFINGVTESFTRSVQIIDSQLMVDLFPDSTICPGMVVSLNPMPDPATSVFGYTWSTGATTPTIDVDSTGTYWVAVESIDPNTGLGSGCLAYDEVNILVYGDTIQIANQWYFGDMAGIDFNENPPLALTDGVSQSPEAAATVSDINGDLLYYTNGKTVYNKEHERMINGDNIGGDSTSAQGALIVQVPEDETISYIFMTDPAWGDQSFDLKYAVVDMKRDTARGAVVLKDRPLYTKSTERLTASSSGGNLIWVVSHEFGNNTFRSYPIDTTGIGNPTFSSEGTRLSPATEGNSRNSMKLSADVSKLVMTIAGAENFVEVFDFVDSTGEVMNPMKINIGEPAPAEIYGVELSSNNEKLYVTTRLGGNSKLLQFDVDTTDVATIEASKFEVANEAQEFGQIQTGPNGIIYMAVDGASALGTISSPNGDDAMAGFVLAGFDLAGRTSTLGLPNFVQNQAQPPQGPSLTVGPGCRGQTISMSATGTSNIDTFEWIFGPTEGGTGPMAPADTSHVYNVPGDYNVQVRITNVCGLDITLTQLITINDNVPRPTVPGVTAICDDTLIIDAYEGSPQLVQPSFFYNWSNGDTTQMITVSVPSTLMVSVTDRATGCVSDTVTVLVGDGRPQVDLGPPTVLCQSTNFGPLDAANPGAAYAWTINGTSSGSGRFQNVNTNRAGVFDYEVAVTDAITGCTGRSTVTITINELPVISLTGNATTGCGNLDGSIDLGFTSAGNFSYSVVSGGAGGAPLMSGSFAGPGTINLPGLGGGNYSVTATNEVTNCARTLSANISDTDAPIISLGTLPACGSEGDLTLGGDPLSATFTWEIIDDAGNLERSGDETNLSTNLLDLDTGVWNIVVRDALPPNCVSTAQTMPSLSELPPAEIVVDPIYNFCGGQGTIPATVTPGSNLTWTLPDGSTAVVNNLTVTQSGTYTVTSTQTAALCPTTEILQVIISNDPIVTIDVSGDPCDGMLTLTASSNDPLAANSFVWGSSDNNNGATGNSIIVSQSGTYTVTNRNQSTGCFSNTSVDVLVEPVLELFITSEPDCDTNPNVFLLAQSNITADVIFEWTDPSGNILPDTTATISVTESGTYQARVIRINSGCDASASFNIIIEPIEDEDLILPTRAVICSLDPTTASTGLDAGVFNTYEWRLLPDETIIGTSQVLTANVEGRYEVTIFNGSTCTRDVIDVIEDCTPRIFAPNAYTPNADGLNDNFFVFSNPFVSDFSIWIHNRWGELIFQADNIDFRWDGEFRGEMAPVGTYAYVVRFRSRVQPALGEIEQHGAVTLIR